MDMNSVANTVASVCKFSSPLDVHFRVFKSGGCQLFDLSHHRRLYVFALYHMLRPSLALLYFALIVLGSLPAYAEENAVVAIRSLTDPVRISTLKDPRACNDRLLKCLYWLASAQTNGQDPAAILEASLAPQVRREMVKEGILRNLVIAGRLGLLTPDNLAALRRGQSPVVKTGPYAGEIAEVDHILPVAKFPQFARSFWNLELMPQTLNRKKGDTVGQRQLDLLKRAQ